MQEIYSLRFFLNFTEPDKYNYIYDIINTKEKQLQNHKKGYVARIDYKYE
jgi:HKD family nuclease